MDEPLLPDLPPALETLARSLYPNPVLARRALLAPSPYLNFRSPWEERSLWLIKDQSPQKRDRRLAFERLLRANQTEFISVEQPFFAASGTLGTLGSPYAQLTDAEYWLYVSLWQSQEAAHTWLKKPLQQLSNKSTLAFLEAAQRPTAIARLIQAFSKQPDPRLQAWYAHIDIIAGNYS